LIFSSLQYLIFLPIVVFLYWRTTGGARLTVVVLASYIFYMSWLPVYGLLLLALTTFNFGIAFAIDKTRPPALAVEGSEDVSESTANNNNGKKSLLHKSIFGLGILVNVGLLFYYKYVNFLVQNLVDAYNFSITQMHAWSILKVAPAQPVDAPILNLILPLGISFFVFEFVHYIVDVYRGDKPMRSFMEFAAFASFFPSQIAGPIKRYKQFTETLRNPTPLTAAQFQEASTLIVQGLFKKVAIADPLGAVVAAPFATMNPLSASDAWIAAVAFFIQVYCDFSGYTDMGRGSALMMGIRLPINFDLPYLARDLTELWRKWHMTLGSWLRDYIYIPLGGSRKGAILQWRNLIITMVACGVWHGASWHYIVFGIAHGVGLGVNAQWREVLDRHPRLKAVCETRPGLLLANFTLVMFLIITYAVFRAPDIPHSINMLSSMVNFNGPCTLASSVEKSGVIYIASLYFLFWLASERMTQSDFLMSVAKSIGLSQDGKSFDWPVRLASWTAACFLMFAARPTEAIPFVYFQF
jgi:alginate O-acetyltransferase complex protein AlgI